MTTPNSRLAELSYDEPKASTFLYVLNSEKYFLQLMKILKGVYTTNSVIYVTTNKPYGLLLNTLAKNQISPEKVFFIDCISKHVGEDSGKDATNCIFVDGPQNLLAISIAVSESVKHLAGEKVLFLDSLSILLMYNDAAAVGKFSNFIINKMRYVGVGTVILALESDIDKDVTKQIASIVDVVKKHVS